MSDAGVQQAVTGELVVRFGLRAEVVHAVYEETGGMCSLPEVVSYLHGKKGLPTLQRDLVSHAVNAVLDEPYPRSPSRRAPYSHYSIAAAAGYTRTQVEGNLPGSPTQAPLLLTG